MGSNKREFAIYEIRLEDRLDPCWSGWFEGLEIRYEQDENTGLPTTVLVGLIPSPANLQKIIRKISDLNLKLLSVNQVLSNSERNL